jgi:calcium permeable stress-gated cation channel
VLSLGHVDRCLISGHSFILLQGLSGTAGGFLQIGPLIVYYLKITLLASTPRSVYTIKYTPRTSAWGTLFPTMTQLVVITLGYSIISPVINGLAFAAFLLFYLLYKYLFTWVNDQPKSSETGGLFFPKALQHIFVGLYVQQVCLCALFFLAQNENQKPSALPEGALMIILIVFTVSITLGQLSNASHADQAFYQDTLRSSYGPLLKDLPLTLADSSYSEAEPEVSKSTDAPNRQPPSSGDAKGIDYADMFASASGQPADDAHDKPTKDETPLSSPSLPAKVIKTEGSSDFRHPATAEDQRIIWLPKDQLGLVNEIEQDLESHDILSSAEGAEMNEKGHVEVTMAAPEDVQHDPKEGSQV